jgi:two-component system response regulator VanR
MDGFEVTKIIRASSDVPIIIMTALQSEEDILKGYSLHVDDYITKPFNPKVLVAKVNNLMMRMDKENSLKMEYKIGELSFDFINSSVTFEGKPLELTKTEFKMLAFLAKNNNKVCSRELLLDEVWGLEVYVDDRIVDAYIKKLRKIIAPKKYIKTVFGTGYRFSIEEK